MNGCGCWCFKCTNRAAGWHCHGPLCEDGKSEDEIKGMHESRSYPLRQESACGQPRPNTSLERTCKACDASFIGLAPGKTGERGIWTADWTWCCSAECAARQGML